MTNYVPCPKCRHTAADRVKFSWWGGVLGPKLLTHVKCQACGNKYNGKSGKPNTRGIVIYSLVIGLVFFGIFFLIAALLVTAG